MKKVILVCNAGMSTGMLAKKIEAASNHTLEVKAYSESEYTDYLAGADLVLIGPQIRFLLPQIEQAVDVPVRAISPMKYGIMDGKGVYEDIVKLIGGE
ncbi:PTS sugar transporter subunit IIB [Enterococcus saccharolyticus]|uniref:PTS sugar transporter subunit IIB n=1 Tax=Candidatus Enterococcus willemsii TaxID=1857215 RepID=A0ABQ6YY36_9ENTE|nr:MULTISPECIES: PTS sugar transporter subunit IIB [Enterococcus]KAF1302916.1 PTS sugar transporter subunit IIB [Enterococcus sp. CU12B]MCD5000934.1 PTS sugar transporter subunit IIB [Enterococcus saccharolyticus]